MIGRIMKYYKVSETVLHELFRAQSIFTDLEYYELPAGMELKDYDNINLSDYPEFKEITE